MKGKYIFITIALGAFAAIVLKKISAKEELLDIAVDISDELDNTEIEEKVTLEFQEIIEELDTLESLESLEDFEKRAAYILEKTENLVEYISFNGTEDSIDATLEFQKKITKVIKDVYKKF